MKFYGELIILILLLITNGRIFFLKRTRLDPAVILAPISFILSILQILAWNIDFFTATTFIISVFVFLSNFHAMFRYSEKVYIDHYSPLMYFWCIITVLATAVILAGLLYFAPVDLRNEQLDITEEKTLVSGTFKGGFHKSSYFEISDGTIRKFSKIASKDISDENFDELSDNGNTSPVLIFFPDKTGDTLQYKPYLQLLSKEGYDVYSGDFFTSDCRWIHSRADSKYTRRFFMTVQKILYPQKFSMNREFYNYNISLECKAMTSFVSEQSENSARKIFLISDTMGINAIKDYAAQNPGKICGTLSLDKLDAYKTSGYGTITQTNPLLAHILQFELASRNNRTDESKKMAEETVRIIRQKTVSTVETEVSNESL